MGAVEQQLARRIHSRLRWEHMRGNMRERCRTPLAVTGCSYVELAQALSIESPLPASIELDHIIPLHAYDLQNSEDVRRAFNWRNLQLLDHAANKRKGKRPPSKHELLRLRQLWPVAVEALLSLNPV